MTKKAATSTLSDTIQPTKSQITILPKPSKVPIYSVWYKQPEHLLVTELKFQEFPTVFNYRGTKAEKSKKKSAAHTIFMATCANLHLDDMVVRRHLKALYFAEIKRTQPIIPEVIPERKWVAPLCSFKDTLEKTEYDHRYYLDVFCSIMAQDFSKTQNPAWLGVIAPPSTGKSYDLSRCLDSKYAVSPDSMTEHGLMAGRPNREAEDPNDIFSMVNNKSLVIKDMASFLGKGNELTNSFIGDLTVAFNGSFQRADPAGIRRYRTNMGVILAMTPSMYYGSIDKFNAFGNRLLMLKYVFPSKTNMRLKDDITHVYDEDDYKNEDAIHEEITQHIVSALKRSWEIEFSPTLLKNLKIFAARIVKLRSCLSARTIHDEEHGSRLYMQLKNLMKSHARLHGRTRANLHDFNFIKPLTFLTISNLDFLYYVWSNKIADVDLAPFFHKGLINATAVGIFKLNEPPKVSYDWDEDNMGKYEFENPQRYKQLMEYVKKTGLVNDVHKVNFYAKQPKI